MSNYTELKRLVDRALTDHRFCGDENHKALADGVLALIGENERLHLDNSSLRGSCARLGAEHAAMSRNFKKANRMQFEARTERDRLKAENEALRRAMHELANHPKLTASQADILRAAMGKGERP